MILNLTKPERAKLYLAIREAIRADNIQKESFAECIAFSHYPDDALSLSRDLDGYIYGILFDSDFQFARIDTSACVEDAETLRLGLGLIGYRRIGRDLFSNAEAGAPALEIQLPKSLE